MATSYELSAAEIERNLALVQERIAAAALRSGRNPAEVRLVVVTKTQPVEVVSKVIAAGAGYLGESYVEEAVPKIQSLQQTLSEIQPKQAAQARPKPLALNKGSGVEWHMIGHVQSRKARQVCEWFDWLHSLDSLKLAQRLDRFAGEVGRVLPVLLECNVSGEESKYGWSAWNEDRWHELVPVFQEICALQSLRVCGLMTIAPFSENPEDARPHFQRLSRFHKQLTEHLHGVQLSELSMGMSADYEVAVEEGSTMVRVGQAILPRND